MTTASNAVSYFRKFVLKHILATDGVSYFIVIPIGATFFLRSVTLSKEQDLAFIYTVAFLAAFFILLNIVWYRYCYGPIITYCGRIDRGEAVDDDLIIRLKERFSSINELLSISVAIRWIAAFIMLSTIVNQAAGISFIQLLNLWIVATVVITFSVVEYNFMSKYLIQKFAAHEIFRGIETVLSNTTRTLLGSITGQIVAASVMGCLIMALMLTVTAILVAHDSLQEFARVIAAGSGSVDSLQIISHEKELAVWMIVMGFFTMVLVAMVLYKSIRDRLQPLTQFRKSIVSIAQGDLTIEPCRLIGGNEVDMLGSATTILTEKIQDIIRGIMVLAGEIVEGGDGVKVASVSLANAAGEQAAGMEEISSTIEELLATIGHNAENTSRADELSENTYRLAESGKEVMNRAINSISAIRQSSKKIADIITLIDEIAFQTNLLALNAAIEAARAGGQGRGFAVVAGEVRNLAKRTTESSKEIKALIGSSLEKVGEGTRLTDETGKSLQEIYDAVSMVRGIINEINTASREQKAGIGQISSAVEQAGMTTQENASASEELSTTAEMLLQKATDLKSYVEFFRVRA